MNHCMHDIVIGGPKRCCGASSCTPAHDPWCKHASKEDKERFAKILHITQEGFDELLGKKTKRVRRSDSNWTQENLLDEMIDKRKKKIRLA